MGQISREELVRCQREVEKQLGTALAGKASDAFCVEFARASWSRPGPPRFIVELTPRTPVPMPDRNAFEELHGRAGGSHEAGGERKSRAGAAASLRDWCVADLRERSTHAAAAILAELRRGSPWELAMGVEKSRSRGAAPPAAEHCWLNQVIRTSTDPRLLAELALDAEIHRVDLPRPLFLEVKESCKSMGAITYRTRSQRTGAGVKVAVIDSEVDADHPAFGNRVERKGNFTDEDFGRPDVHGTAIAGIIAANDNDFVGMAPGATIFHYKVFSPQGTASDDFDGACALARALEDKARIANCSWGTAAPTDGTSREARMCDHAWRSGMTVVKSAGHGGKNPLAITSPGDAEGVIVVGATDRVQRRIMAYSSRGPTENGRERPHLVAPGGSRAGPILTCDLADGFGKSPAGTSLAAAHVSGALALLLEAEPELTPDQQRDRLISLCIPYKQKDPNKHGAGFLSLDNLP
jgi:serine protease AprX